MRGALAGTIVAWVVVVAVIVSPASAEDTWAVRSGVVVVNFNVSLLHDLGLDLSVEAPPFLHDDDILIEAPSWTFPIRKDSDFRFVTDGGVVRGRGVEGGVLRLDGRIIAVDRASHRRHRFDDLVIVRVGDGASPPEPDLAPAPLQLRSATSGLVLCELASSMFDFRGRPTLRVHYLNARIAEPWARSIGRPDLAGWVIGMAEVRAGATLVSTTPSSTVSGGPALGGVVDVRLGDLSSIQQVDRAGPYPGGAAALSLATTACNVGTSDVPWLAPMNVDHPFIHMALYRLLDGRFEQVGVSWMKHGFYALSDQQCTPCQHPSDGTFLGVGCSDTYDVSNNAERDLLGPRSEVNPYTGIWECTGSHFSNGYPDCILRHDTCSCHGPLSHRLTAADSVLDNPASNYYYEAMYVVRGDVNLANNWGSRNCSMRWNGSVWRFTTHGGQLEGPALGRWGELSTVVDVAAGDGQALLAVQTTDLGGGRYQYEYALLNMNSDRQIRSFTVPVQGVTNVTGIGFHDNDGDPSSDWQATIQNGDLTWQTGMPGGIPSPQPLVFGYLFNFRFQADAPPAAVNARLGLFKPGPGTQALVATRGPLNDVTAVGSPPMPTARLVAIRPNPFTKDAMIAFEMARPGPVTLVIHDPAGRRVRGLIDETRGAGAHVVVWDGTTDAGTRAAAGVYHARLQAGDATAVRALVVLQ